MSPKRRTDLKIWPSKAKNLEELDSDVRKTLAPPKSSKKDEKQRSEIVKNSDFFFDVFGTTKGRSRLKFWQRVVLDVPVRSARPKNLQNKIF